MTISQRNCRPHVLLVTADHWPGALLGAAGHPVVRTPTLDQLARCGTRFPRAYTECPVCIPARRTLLTGTTPRTHGDRSFAVHMPLPSTTTIAQAFREAGYQAYAVGKLHVYPPRARAGFDDVILCEEGRPGRTRDGRPAVSARHEQQRLRGSALAFGRIAPRYQLAHTRNGPHDPAPRSHAARFLVSVLHASSSAPRAG